MSKRSTPTIQVVIRKSDGILWEGQVTSFSSTNEVGKFDILPEHAHFVGSISQFIMVRAGNGEKKWEIETGIMSVVDGVIEVFLGY
jgi:F0F1-type ATP synthase epsilon subunit